MRYEPRVIATPADLAALPNVHGLFPEELVAHLGQGATLGHARSLLASCIAFHPALRPKRSAIPRPVREAWNQLDHRQLEVVDRALDPSDGFLKYLLRSPDGSLSEAVRIPLEKDGCFTICLSSQVGCAMGCVFCATGRMGLSRNLEAWEIVSAFTRVRDELDPAQRITGAVFMGQGEPLHNYDGVIRAAKILSDPNGGRIRAEAISISTVGLVPEIRRYTAEGHRYRLVVSLTSAISSRRKSLLPVTRKWDLPELAAAIADYAAARRERVTLAWVVMSGVNTGQDEVDALRALLPDTAYKLNLIDINASADSPATPGLGLDASAGSPAPTGIVRMATDEAEFARASAAELDAFRDRLRALGQPVVRRYSGGRAQHAACGMLASLARETGP